jgi:hypothetical protein
VFDCLLYFDISFKYLQHPYKEWLKSSLDPIKDNIIKIEAAICWIVSNNSKI